MAQIRMAQYGTKHGHAAGKAQSMQQNPDVELVGIFEPDSERRRELGASGSAFKGVNWFDDKREMLEDGTIAAIASEGSNAESLGQTEEIVEAGKHVWYDKPAGDNWEQWQRVMVLAGEKELLIQMGYMFRYHDGYRQIDGWTKSGLLGDIFEIRAHMSTSVPAAGRQTIGLHAGGIFYDLAGHQLDQIVWLLGRPTKVTSFLRNDTGVAPEFKDNTLGVFEYENAIVLVDIAALETRPTARRFEVYGSRGSAIMEPMEPARQIRLCLGEAQEGYREGEQFVPVEEQTRQGLYDLELEAFLASISGAKEPDRSPEHELLVQETLLRGTGGLSG